MLFGSSSFALIGGFDSASALIRCTPFIGISSLLLEFFDTEVRETAIGLFFCMQPGMLFRCRLMDRFSGRLSILNVSSCLISDLKTCFFPVFWVALDSSCVTGPFDNLPVGLLGVVSFDVLEANEFLLLLPELV